MTLRRQEFDRRPLVAITVGLIAGLSGHWIGAAFLLAALAIAIRPGVRLAILAAGVLGLFLMPTPAAPLSDKAEFAGEGRVASVPRIYPEVTTFVFESRGLRLMATAQGPAHVSVGDQLKVDGSIKPPSVPSARLYADRGLNGRLKITHCEKTATGPLIYAWADAWRWSFLDFAQRTLAPNRAAVASALAFNLDSLLDDGQNEAFRRGGTLHIVSASGAHVAMIAASLAMILGLTPLPRGAQVGLLALILAFYAVTAGLGPPIVRSAIMGILLGSAYLWRREGDFASALATAAILILLWNPHALRDMGFQLSFVTVGMMGLFGGSSALRQGLVASAASMPLVAYHFGQIPLLALPANILIALGVGVATVGGMAAHLLSLVWFAGGALLMQWLVGPSVAFVEEASRWVGAPEWAVLRCPEIPAWLIAAFYAGLLACWRPKRRDV
ncbi:hypothetical protein BH11ARM2_BH11ARM2_10180 [soil metagenome]